MESKSLMMYLNGLSDPRKAKGKRHEQEVILIIIILGLMMGRKSMREIARFASQHSEELSKKLPLHRRKVPSLMTLIRTLDKIDQEELCDCFNKWMEQFITTEAIAIDGKSLGSTAKNIGSKEQNFVSMVSFFGQRSELILKMEIMENKKESEIKIVESLLEEFKIEEGILTLDALHTQKKTVLKIEGCGGGYIVPVKKNQMGLYKEIQSKDKEEKPLSKSYWKQRGHGHSVKCKIRVWKAEEKLQKNWGKLTQYIAITRKGYRDKKWFERTTYYITNTDLSAYRLGKTIRGHRKIENTLHWTKDVIMKEDECGIRQNKPAGTLGILRNISFNLLKMTGIKSVKKAMEKALKNLDEIWTKINLPTRFF